MRALKPLLHAAALGPLCLLSLAACDSPGLSMRGGVTHQVAVGPSRFSVHVLGTRVEAIRTNVEFGPAARGVMARGHTAIEQATGCQIVPGTFDGDPALMRAEIFCG